MPRTRGGRGCGRFALYEDAEAVAPTTRTEADDSSADANREPDMVEPQRPRRRWRHQDPAHNVYIEVTMRRVVNGEQLGRTGVYNVTRGASDHIASLGTLIAQAQKLVTESSNEMHCCFVQANGTMVNCAERVYDKIEDYVSVLERIPTEEGGPLSRRNKDSRYYRLILLLWERPRLAHRTEAPDEYADREPLRHG